MARIKDITIDGTLTGTERLVSTDADLSTKNITVDTLKQFILTGQGTALTFPSTTGSAGQVLVSQGSSILDWGNGFTSLTTTGTSGVATLAGGALNVPNYTISLTTTGTSGAATLTGGTLNIPQYLGVPVGNDTEIQFNNSGAFGASSSLTWDGSLLSASALTTAGVIQNEKVQITNNSIRPSAGNTTEGVISTTHKEVKTTNSSSPVDLSSSYFDITFVFTDAGTPTLNIANATVVPVGTHVIVCFTGATGTITTGSAVSLNGSTNASISVIPYEPKHLINIGTDSWILG
jgi:hypothetical protein